MALRIFIFAWGPAAAWAAVLFLLSAQPDLPLDGWLGIPDEVKHFVAYAVLGAALAHARFHGRGRPPHFAMIAAGALYGITDEWHQSFVPGRSPALGDWLADVAGVTVGYALAWLVVREVVRRTGADIEGETT